MPNFVVLGCLEVGEKFTVGGVGWWVGGGISTPTAKSNQLKLGQVDVELGCDNYPFQYVVMDYWKETISWLLGTSFLDGLLFTRLAMENLMQKVYS